MSSLAASRADGFYFPPDYDPEKHGSLNQYNGQHPLRERAAKLDQGILVIRFEMPFNVWCAGCNHLIGKGVRFNADKKQIGNYYSTKIWSFTMNAPCCGQKIEVQTDPKNTEYQVVSGGRRKVETWTAESAETIELPEKEEQQFAPRVDDTFARLEKGEADKLKAKELNSRVAELFEDSNEKYRNDYQLNKDLRRQNRAKREVEKDLDKKRKALGLSSDVTLLPESEEDKFQASCIDYGDPANYNRKWQQKRKAIKSQSIFAPSALTKLGQKWDRFGQALSSKERRNSIEEAATPPSEHDPVQRIHSYDSSITRGTSPCIGDCKTETANTANPSSEARDLTPSAETTVYPRQTDSMDTDLDSRASTQSTQSDEDLLKTAPQNNFDVNAANESWPADPVKCRRLDADPQIWVCQREASATKAKFFKCPLNTIREDTEMDCSQLGRDRHGRSHDGRPKVMRKLDKAKCRQQLTGSSSCPTMKTASLAQCQQKLKKTSISDKIAAALKRH